MRYSVVVAKFTGQERGELPRAVFGLPAGRKYPMPDPSHAANAKARATQQERAGNLTPAQEAQINAKANRVLNRGPKKLR